MNIAIRIYYAIYKLYKLWSSPIGPQINQNIAIDKYIFHYLIASFASSIEST